MEDDGAKKGATFYPKKNPKKKKTKQKEIREKEGVGMECMPSFESCDFETRT